MKDLNTLWNRYRKSEAKNRVDANNRDSNPAQVGAATRAFNRFFRELKAQRGLTDTEAVNVMNTEFKLK